MVFLNAVMCSFVLFSYVLKHDDGRVSYPLCFIFISPQGKCKVHDIFIVKMMSRILLKMQAKVFTYFIN